MVSNSSDRAIFEFALTWRVLQNETVFKYSEPNAQSWGYYHNESFNFVPIFLDEIKSNTTALMQQLFSGNYTFYQQANTTCYSTQYDDNYYQCLVDVAYSGSLAAGSDSQKQRAAIANSQQQIANAGPSISGAPSYVAVRWNQANYFSFLVISSHQFNVTVLAATLAIQSNSSSNFTSSNTTVMISNDIPSVLSMNSSVGNATNVTLYWTPEALNLTGFTVTVTDLLGATASWAPVTYYCTCVSTAAVCLYPNVSQTSSISNSTNSTTNTSKMRLDYTYK